MTYHTRLSEARHTRLSEARHTRLSEARHTRGARIIHTRVVRIQTMNKNLIGVLVGVVVLALGGLYVYVSFGSGTQTSGSPPSVTSPESSGSAMCANKPAANTSLKDADVKELKKEDTKIGTGTEAVAGKTVVVNYIGRLVNGKQFDASCDRGQPFDFVLGAGGVIQGWDQGVAGMKIGGQRRLIIPSSLGYGENGAGADIPANAALIFDVELLEVR
jgi:peptidylprolyl isomerase